MESSGLFFESANSDIYPWIQFNQQQQQCKPETAPPSSTCKGSASSTWSLTHQLRGSKTHDCPKKLHLCSCLMLIAFEDSLLPKKSTEIGMAMTTLGICLIFHDNY
mmetsp:Transcript_24970/g.40876  ORF Transcript_24970/g.40876 Transcript_24970/m.40876 type:complete len:106 (-) Transcript_24970:1166-1483(-)